MELDEQLIRDACRKVKLGHFPEQALIGCGAPAPEAARWLAAGREAQQEGQTPDDRLEVALVAAVDIAAADFEGSMLARALGASNERNWQRFFVALDKRFPERYGRTPQVGKKYDNRSLEDILDQVTAEQKAKP